MLEVGTDDNTQLFARKCCAQSEGSIIFRFAADRVKRGIAANGLSRRNALLCASFEGLALPPDVALA